MITYDKRIKSRMITQVERARRAIRVFFLIRELSLTLNMEVESQLPLTNPANCVQVNNVLDLSKIICLLVNYLQSNKVNMLRYFVCNLFLFSVIHHYSVILIANKIR